MIALAVVTDVLLAVGVALLLWPLLQSRRQAFAVRCRVVVNLLDDTAVEGVLWRRAGRTLVVRDARLHQPGREPTPVDGEILLDRDRVAFVQKVG